MCMGVGVWEHGWKDGCVGGWVDVCMNIGSVGWLAVLVDGWMDVLVC